MTTYQEMLRDPRWQRRRLEIMQQDNFTCQWCGNKEQTLNVHHLYYDKGKAPWEYPDSALITLCESCHEEDKENRKDYESDLLDTIRRVGLDCGEIECLSSSIYGCKDIRSPDRSWNITDILMQLLSDREIMSALYSAMDIASDGVCSTPEAILYSFSKKLNFGEQRYIEIDERIKLWEDRASRQ